MKVIPLNLRGTLTLRASKYPEDDDNAQFTAWEKKNDIVKRCQPSLHDNQFNSIYKVYDLTINCRAFLESLGTTRCWSKALNVDFSGSESIFHIG